MAEDNKYKLLSILQSHAPNSEAQKKVTDYYHTLLRENKSNDKEVELQLAGAIFDGLSYGNWLWNK